MVVVVEGLVLVARVPTVVLGIMPCHISNATDMIS